MSTNKQALREKFEAWAEEAGALPWGHLKKQRTASGNYSVQIYTYMWKAWSACHEVLLDELEAAEKRIAEFGGHLKSAHAFIENTEAFGYEAASGILKCGDSEWNVDASKESLAAAGITVKGE